MRFSILSRLGVAHECNGQTDKQTDRSALAIGMRAKMKKKCNANFTSVVAVRRCRFYVLTL